MLVQNPGAIIMHTLCNLEQLFMSSTDTSGIGEDGQVQVTRRLFISMISINNIFNIFIINII
jgi:hypothetical protein